MHIADESTIADHCMTYALSDSRDSSFRQRCQQVHEEHCSECDSMNSVLNETIEFIEQDSFPSKDDSDEAQYLAQHSRDTILAWKAHQFRTVRQDKARLEILENLDYGSVFLTQDWAMKFLPRKYRESQSDWYGKRGISWHISIDVHRHNNQLESQGFVHIIQNCTQGSSAVVEIMAHVLNAWKTEHPEIQKAFFRQDNAGCYHSAITIMSVLAIEKATGVKVAEVSFSDPQGGKEPADRMAAFFKGHITRFVNKDNNVTNAKEMEKSVLSHGGLPGIRVAVLDRLGESESTAPRQKITGISKLNNFSFCPGGVKMWQAFGIGPGKDINLEAGNGKFSKPPITFCYCS